MEGSGERVEAVEWAESVESFEVGEEQDADVLGESWGVHGETRERVGGVLSLRLVIGERSWQKRNADRRAESSSDTSRLKARLVGVGSA